MAPRRSRIVPGQSKFRLEPIQPHAGQPADAANSVQSSTEQQTSSTTPWTENINVFDSTSGEARARAAVFSGQLVNLDSGAGETVNPTHLHTGFRDIAPDDDTVEYSHPLLPFAPSVFVPFTPAFTPNSLGNVSRHHEYEPQVVWDGAPSGPFSELSLLPRSSESESVDSNRPGPSDIHRQSKETLWIHWRLTDSIHRCDICIIFTGLAPRL